MLKLRLAKGYVFFQVVTAILCVQADMTSGICDFTQDCCQFNSQLKLSELCVDKLSVNCVKATQIETDKICAPNVCSDLVCTKDLNVSGKLVASQFAANLLCANTFAGKNVYTTNNLYTNDYHTKYRATTVYSGNTNYTLGSVLEFNTILDDPNNNMTLTPSTYTAPKSGYYMVTLQIDQYDLVTTTQILGSPVGNIQILVNGIVWRQAYSPYLSFFNSQNNALSSLISLNAGDKVTCAYKVLTMDQILGVQDIVGTVTIDGTGTEANNSIFKIHYLSSNGDFPTPPACRPVTVDCSDCLCAPCCNTK